MVKVSVVIPVYNVEDFLEECLDSVVNQTLRDIEIICVNDGSPDNSLRILEEYARRDSRITVINQDNAGHAVASNRGIDLAKGEYLYLMDSDDIVELTALEETYNYARKKKVDFVLFQAINYDYSDNKYYESEIYNMDRLYDCVGDSVFNYRDIGDLVFAIPVTPWSKLYKNSFIQRNNIRFPEGLVFDDNIFFWDVLFCANRIAFYKKHLFTRRWYSYSSTKAGDLRFIDSIAINNLMIDRFKKYGQFEKHKKTLYNRKINLTFDKYCFIKKEFQEQFYEALHKDFMDIVEQGLYEDYISVLDRRNRKIFESGVESESYTEFQYEMAYYDTHNSRLRIDNENKELEKEINKYKQENTNLINETKLFDKKQDQLKKDDEIIFLNNKVKNSEAHLKNLKNTQNQLQIENEKLKEINKLYKESNSWQMTEPLRKIGRKF